MTSCLRFACFLLALIAVTFANYGKCTSDAARRAIKLCSFRLVQHKKIGATFSFTDQNLQNYKSSCDPLVNCLISLERCDIFENGQSSIILTKIKTMCDLVDFVGSSTCHQKLKDRNSQCYQDFEPRLTEAQKANDKTKKKACENYFGEKACMELEVTSTCSRDEWIQFRDLYTNLISEIWKECEAADVNAGMIVGILERSVPEDLIESSGNPEDEARLWANGEEFLRGLDIYEQEEEKKYEREQMKRVQEENQRLQKEIESLKKENQRLKKQKNRILEEKEILVAEKKELQEQNEQLSEENNHHQAEIERHQEETEQLQEEKEILEEQMNGLQEENERLEKENGEYRENEERHQKLIEEEEERLQKEEEEEENRLQDERLKEDQRLLRKEKEEKRRIGEKRIYREQQKLIQKEVERLQTPGQSHEAHGIHKQQCASEEEQFDINHCRSKFTQHKKLLKTFDVSKKSKRKQYKKSCEQVVECMTALKECDIFVDGHQNYYTTIIKTSCDIMNFNTESKCQRQLVENNSKCFQNFNPDLREDRMRFGESRKAACLFYFGQNACLKKEITETCGEKEWYQFRTMYTNYAVNISQDCTLADIQTGLAGYKEERDDETSDYSDYEENEETAEDENYWVKNEYGNDHLSIEF